MFDDDIEQWIKNLNEWADNLQEAMQAQLDAASKRPYGGAWVCGTWVKLCWN